MFNDTPQNYVDEWILNSIRWFPTVYKSKIDVLIKVFTTYVPNPDSVKSVDDCMEFPFDGRDFKISEELGIDYWKYGTQNHITIPCGIAENCLLAYLEPDTLKEEWIEPLQEFVLYYNKMTEEAIEAHILSRCHIWYSPRSVGFEDYKRRYTDGFKTIRKLTNDVAKRFGWHYWTIEEWHNPKKVQERTAVFSKMLDEVLEMQN